MEKFYSFNLNGLISKNYIQICLIVIVLAGCQSQKNLVKSKDGKLSVDKEVVIKDLNSIIDTESELTIEEKKALLDAIKDHGFQDTELDSLVAVAENSLYFTESTSVEIPKSTEAATETTSSVDASVTQDVLNSYFSSIINLSENDDSEEIITETLSYFESSESPVLIILQEVDGKVFYDRPTTIEKYLYYLKDMKKSSHQIQKLNFSDNEKINKMILANN